MLYEKFSDGINLGGYLSQYEIVADVNDPADLEHHFAEFIREEDIARIASWGLDHVRIPVDGRLFYDREAGCLVQNPMADLDRLLSWAAKYRLNAIIDLHNFPGHVFGQMDVPTPLMTDEALRKDFVRFWVLMAEHYRHFDGVTLLFELFNEMADATGYQWNKLCRETVEAIRAVDGERWILIGSNNVNSIGWLDRLALLDDERVFYNFHYYEPNCFTHQLAHFSEEMRTFGQAMAYPGDMREYLAFLEKHPGWKAEHDLVTGVCTDNDAVLMRRNLRYAKDFLTYTGRELMCTEYGVIDSADEAEAVKWLRDIRQLFDGLRIGHTMWNYKELDFEVVNMGGEIVREKVLGVLKKR